MDENVVGGFSQHVHPMNFNHPSFKQQQQHQQYGTPVSDTGFTSSSYSSTGSFGSLATSNLGSSFSSSVHSTSTMGSPPNHYYSTTPQQHSMGGQASSLPKSNNFNSPTTTNNNYGNKAHNNGGSQMRPIIHSRPMSWDDVGEYTRQSYSTSCSSNGGLYMNELSSSMDDLTISSSPGFLGGNSSFINYGNSFGESKDNLMTSTHTSSSMGNIFVRSVVGKVLSDMDESLLQEDGHDSQQSSFKPLQATQYHHQRATSMDRHFYNTNNSTQQQFKNSIANANRRTLSMSCPTSMTQVNAQVNNSVGYQLFQQQLSPPMNGFGQENSTTADSKKQLCRFYYSPEGCKFGDNCSFAHSTNSSNNNNTIHLPPNNTRMVSPMMVQEQVSPYQQQPDSLTVVNFNNSYSPSLSQSLPSSNGVSPMVDSNPFPPTNNSTVSNGMPTTNTSNNSTALSTQQVCQFFKKGECKFGDKCRNIHLKNKSKIDEQSRKKLKGIRCRFGVNCPFGHECYYFHTESDFDDTHSSNYEEK